MVWCFLISELGADMEKMDKEAGNSFCAFVNVRDVVKLFFFVLVGWGLLKVKFLVV